MRVVVMGVAGSGKTTIGRALAERWGCRFVDGDDLHPAANVDKMAAGIPLDDADRWPWLARVREVLRDEASVVVACSALARRYRDMLRQALGVRFAHLTIDAATATARITARSGHYMGASMVGGQFAALEPPAPDETDVLTVDDTGGVEDKVARITAEIGALPTGFGTTPDLAFGGPTADIGPEELAGAVDETARQIAGRARRVVLVPPDHTRLHSYAGEITARLFTRLRAAGCEVAVLPALGTHVAMGGAQRRAMFGDGIPDGAYLVHDWRGGLTELGTITADEIGVLTGGQVTEALDVAVDRQIFDGWDVVVSIGQVVPHEVIGMANFTKNVVIGLGGAATIHRSHFIGAVSGMERLMGEASSPVRDVVDAAFDRFVAPLVDVSWILTVVEDAGDRRILRGLFTGRGGTAHSGGAAYRAAAALAAEANITVLDRPLQRVACWLDPVEFHSTWLGNKAIYRTRMVMAGGGELLVLAPAVRRFGEDALIDELIRRHGYRGTATALAAVAADAQLAANLGAAAHLIHGSSEGRFRIVYCTDPQAGGLSRDEVESAGYEWRALGETLDALGLDPLGSDAGAVAGPRRDRAGGEFFYVPNPALGLWKARPPTGR